MRFINSIILSSLTVVILASCTSNNAQVAPTAQKQDTIVRKIKDTISIVAVGDIMLGSAFPSKVNLPPDDAVNSFQAVDSLLKGDIVFGNLEGCFLNSGSSNKCNGINPNNCYAFRMPERYAGIYKKAGFNVLSIANNHVGDFDTRGRKNTARILDSLQIHYAGQLNKPFEIFEKDSVKYAFCAFAPNENTVSIKNIDSAKALVARLKTMADIVIVSFHGGGEGARFEHVTKKTEIFYNENRGNVYAFAHGVIDAGADVVLGHGPHVTRAVEVYKNKFIAYSLGNFCTYGMFSLKGWNGFAPLLQLKINAKGDFLYADVVSVKQDKINRLTLDENHNAFNRIKQLTDIDFTGHPLQFENNKITVKN
ncbi:CapA family protein [Pedobacter rhizosphaerae]|uniref:Poly-gamma-glutamate biosynthesis protein CapA/YwtB (Capsule formation), metallophosphatase superfamily n=1 Tax=Pedobacter rhizosphaerae TaxID=390241 RepID=A0A1H9T8L0_9SPHI|nr:CapA family protein [Pedobacter rhizosphaerae]SER93478.1 Poly-gamma-glutamate biosynthesis protein CapA/YwtB (capsule formation), metallophosphatase superfamily [Pedobacter rhizosphaerae]